MMKQSRFNHIAPIGDGGYGLYNFYTGKYVYLSFLTRDYYDHPELYPASHPQIQKLKEDGFLVDYDELTYLESMVRLDCGRSDIVRFSICPTLSCNFACPYCYETARSGKMTPQVQEDVIRFAEKLIRINHARWLHIYWYGGEPLLCPDVIRSLSGRLISLCEEKGINYSANIITNGYLLNGETARMFDACRIRSIQITLDGPDAEVHNRTRHLRGGGGTFDQILENIRNFPGSSRMDVRCNVQKDNMPGYTELERKLEKIRQETGKDISVYGARMESHGDCGDRELPLEEFLEFKKKTMKEITRFCFHGPVCTVPQISDFIVDERGNLFKCLESAGVEEDVIGNVRDFDPRNPATGNMDNLTKCLSAAWPGEDEECMNCPALPACMGGCPHHRMHQGKQCRGYKYALDEYVIELGKELLRRDRKRSSGAADISAESGGPEEETDR